MVEDLTNVDNLNEYNTVEEDSDLENNASEEVQDDSAS